MKIPGLGTRDSGPPSSSLRLRDPAAAAAVYSRPVRLRDPAAAAAGASTAAAAGASTQISKFRSIRGGIAQTHTHTP